MSVTDTARPGSGPDDPRGDRWLRVETVRTGLAVVAVAALWLLVAEAPFSFDKGETLGQYPVVTGFGPWRWIAELMAAGGFGGQAFYRVVALGFAVSYAAVARWVWPRSRFLALGISAYFLLWFGFGQLRYGTALLCLMLAQIERRRRPLAAFVLLLLAGSTHTAAGAGAVAFLGWSYLVGRSIWWVLVPLASAYGLLAIFGVSKLTLAVLALTGYENYGNWLTMEAPNTPYKYAYVIGVLAASALIGRRPFWRELLFAATLVPSAFSPPLAGRAYAFLMAATTVTLLDHEESKRPSAWVCAALGGLLIAEAISLARGDLLIMPW